MAIISISDSQINSADQVLVADASSKIPAKDGSQITILNATNVASGTIATARLDTGTTANKIVVLDGSGNLPVVDGSLLTGVVSATVSASDPTISTNPSAGLGAEWNNSTSGEMYICTDATAGANVWTNVGPGTGDIKPMFQGSNYGYTSGGNPSNIIDKFSLSSDANATDVGDLTSNMRGSSTGSSSATNGYQTGAHYSPGSGDDIEKFSFASDGNATANYHLTHTAKEDPAGQSSTNYGYTCGGYPDNNIIDKFSMVTDADSTDVGDLATITYSYAAQSSATHGYTSGGYLLTTIQRFSFATDGNSVDTTQDLTTTRFSFCGQSSATHGYTASGHYGPGNHNVIDKFAFDSSVNATDIGDCTGSRRRVAGVSSITHGYCSGGYTGPAVDIIDKFSFTTDGNATDIANLTTARDYVGGNQY